MTSEFSVLVNRMHQVFQQFQTRNDLKKLDESEILLEVIEPKFGPAIKFSKVKDDSRILIVDDQVFNIEFLRCQLELIPAIKGRCDYVDNGLSAV